jgi:hypothetical protein
MRRFVIVVFVLALALGGPALAKKPVSPGGSPASSATIAATPNPVVFGGLTTISGQVTGKKNSGAAVSLESKPFPYTAPFTKIANATADATGHYSFKVVPSLNTIYHAVAKVAPAATSLDLLVKVRVRVTLSVSTTKPAVGQLVRFQGFVIPAYNGQAALIQRKTPTGWRTVARAKLVAASPLATIARSKYTKRLQIRSSGTYRVRFAPADGSRLANTSPTRALTVH